MATPAQIAANGRNAKKSTGPISPEGKARSSKNATKHGLRSQEIVLPGEDPAAFEESLAAWIDDWQPPTQARRVLVELCAAHAWRLRRCLKVERDHLIARGQQAVAARRDAGRARAEAVARSLDFRPDEVVAELRSEREGVAWLADAWAALAGALGRGEYDEARDHARLMNLLGRDRHDDAEAVGEGPAASWLVAAVAVGQQIPDAAVATLGAFLAAREAELRGELTTRFAAEEAELARLAEAVTPDDSPEGRALLRYEAQHGRDFRAALNQLIKLAQTGADLVAEAEADPEPASGPSPGAESPPQAVPDEVVKSPEPPEPNEANSAAGESTKANEGEPIGGVPTSSRSRESRRARRRRRSHR
jgi:hypothetical protein